VGLEKSTHSHRPSEVDWTKTPYPASCLRDAVMVPHADKPGKISWYGKHSTMSVDKCHRPSDFTSSLGVCLWGFSTGAWRGKKCPGSGQTPLAREGPADVSDNMEVFADHQSTMVHIKKLWAHAAAANLLVNLSADIRVLYRFSNANNES